MVQRQGAQEGVPILPRLPKQGLPLHLQLTTILWYLSDDLIKNSTGQYIIQLIYKLTDVLQSFNLYLFGLAKFSLDLIGSNVCLNLL